MEYRALNAFERIWYKKCLRRDVRAAEGARLEIVCTLTRTEGSNPCASHRGVQGFYFRMTTSGKSRALSKPIAEKDDKRIIDLATDIQYRCG
jgi:hypothetical protein